MDPLQTFGGPPTNRVSYALQLVQANRPSADFCWVDLQKNVAFCMFFSWAEERQRKRARERERNRERKTGKRKTERETDRERDKERKRKRKKKEKEKDKEKAKNTDKRE